MYGKVNEIDHRTMKLLVGVIALGLAWATNSLAGGNLTSISESYYAGDWPRGIFIGSLFSIASFLVAYNGQSTPEMILSKVAAIAAIGVALFPCGCNGHEEIMDGVHGGSAAVMFFVLTGLCWIFYQRASRKEGKMAKFRAFIYLLCGATMLGSVLVLFLATKHPNLFSAHRPDIIFWGERLGLTAFGIAWLTASHLLPLIDVWKPIQRGASALMRRQTTDH